MTRGGVRRWTPAVLDCESSGDFSRSLREGDRCGVEVAHKSPDGADARDGFVTVSGSDFGVFRPFFRERPSAKSLSLRETRLTGGAVALGSWRFESSRPGSASASSPDASALVSHDSGEPVTSARNPKLADVARRARAARSACAPLARASQDCRSHH